MFNHDLKSLQIPTVAVNEPNDEFAETAQFSLCNSLYGGCEYEHVQTLSQAQLLCYHYVSRSEFHRI